MVCTPMKSNCTINVLAQLDRKLYIWLFFFCSNIFSKKIKKIKIIKVISLLCSASLCS